MCFLPVSIFEESEDPALFENHEHVLLLMEKFLFIASPLTQLEEPEDPDCSGCNRQLEESYPTSDLNQSDDCSSREVTDDVSEDGSEKVGSALRGMIKNYMTFIHVF